VVIPGEASTFVNEKSYPWIADIPDDWTGVKQNLSRELNNILDLPGKRRGVGAV